MERVYTVALVTTVTTVGPHGGWAEAFLSWTVTQKESTYTYEQIP